jgi:hypothetical protein
MSYNLKNDYRKNLRTSNKMDGCQGAWQKNHDLGGWLPYDNDQLFVGFFSVALSLHFCKAMVVGYVFSSIDKLFTIEHKHF